MYYFNNEKTKNTIKEPEHLARKVLIGHQMKLAPVCTQAALLGGPLSSGGLLWDRHCLRDRLGPSPTTPMTTTLQSFFTGGIYNLPL